MATLHTTSHQPDQLAAAPLSFKSVNSSHAIKHAGYKIAGVILFLSICAVIMILATSTASGKDTSDKQDATTSAPNVGLDQQTTQNTDSTTPANSSQNTGGTQSSSGNSNSSSVNVTVNGQNVPVPANGSVSKTVTGNDGSTTTTNVSSTHAGAGTNDSFSSTDVNVHSSGSASINYSSNSTGGGG